MKKPMIFAGAVLLSGCAAAPPTPVRAPSAEPAPRKNVAEPAPDRGVEDPWSLPAGPRDPASAAARAKDVSTAAWARAVKAKGVAPRPPRCASFAKPPRASEGSGDVASAALAPVECADAVVDPSLTSAATASGASGQMAIGLSLAAKLARTATGAPVMKDAGDKEKVKRFIQGPLRGWMVEQASAIEALSAPAAELEGLARAVVALEAGTADLRLVDGIRSAPTPRSWDAELRAIYEAALDEALEPRKARGRDAALVGLADLAAAGILHDARVDRARALLSKMYGGRRIDALDALLLPAHEAEARPGSELATHVRAADAAASGRSPGAATEPARDAARARFERGRTYWRRVDFVEAAHAAATSTRPDDRLVLALSLALARGPVSAKEMMACPSPAALGVQATEALDALAAEPSSVAGMAAYDAAHLRSLAPPDGADAGPWFTDVAARFEKAATLLERPEDKARAKERAAAALAIAKAAGGEVRR